MREVVPFPSVPPNYCKNIAIRWGNHLTQVVLPHNKVCTGLSNYLGGGSLCCTDPACVSQQPQRYMETDAVVGPDLILNSALPNPTGQPVWGRPRAPSLLERQLTLGTAELLADQAGL